MKIQNNKTIATSMLIGISVIALTLAVLSSTISHDAFALQSDSGVASNVALHEKLLSSHQLLTQKMTNKDSDIPVNLSYVAANDTLIVGIDDKAPLPKSVYHERLKLLLGDIPMKVGLGHATFNSLVCSTRNSDCTPVIGGISLEDVNGTGWTLGSTLSVGATDSSFRKGFIMSGHPITYGRTQVDVGQATLASRVVGKVVTNPSPNGLGQKSSDAAFVEFSKNIFGQYIFSATGTVYYASNSGYNVIGEKTSSQAGYQTPVRMSGWGSNAVTSGYVVGTNLSVNFPGVTLIHQVAANYASVGGDSGAPVFSVPDGSNNVYYYGIHVGIYDWGGGATTAIYSPWEQVQGDLSISTIP